MQHAFQSGKVAVIALLATAMLGLPEAALARDRCSNNNSNSRYSQSSSYNDGYRNRGTYNTRDRSSSTYRNNSGSYGNNNGYYNDDYRYNEPRSAGKSAAIIGGGAAAGAAIGGLTGGVKGAIIGAAVGGAGGLIYDRTTKNRTRNGW
ncbi:MAG: hypothetical protein SGI92_04645 [Bryobacteraceae bacterium]|nr:hypothetical protein [Bryobacteraceae bacterium]